jgi:hypothetical protein
LFWQTGRKVNATPGYSGREINLTPESDDAPFEGIPDEIDCTLKSQFHNERSKWCTRGKALFLTF